MAILEARNVHFSYPDGFKALNGINLKVAKGEFVALLGANGCGKTTLFQHFNCLLQPQEGEIFLEGKSSKEKKTEEIFQTVGLVFQDPNDQLFATGVFEDVSYGPTNLGLPREDVYARVKEALELVGMWDLRGRNIRSLSFGQKKRVAVAGMLALRPRILILDEPTAGLDPRTASKLMQLLQEVQHKSGLTVILSTHEVDYVPIYCNRVYVMNQGEIVMAGSPEEVFAQKEKIRQANLRLPRIGHLLEILKGQDGFNLPGLPALTISTARLQLNRANAAK